MRLRKPSLRWTKKPLRTCLPFVFAAICETLLRIIPIAPKATSEMINQQFGRIPNGYPPEYASRCIGSWIKTNPIDTWRASPIRKATRFDAEPLCHSPHR